MNAVIASVKKEDSGEVELACAWSAHIYISVCQLTGKSPVTVIAREPCGKLLMPRATGGVKAGACL